jgi:hypothetical protein
MNQYTKVIYRMKNCGYGEKTINYVIGLLESMVIMDIERIDRLESALYNAISDVKGFLNHLAEGEIALKLALNGFHIVYEPLGSKGPDLSASWADCNFYIEVSRFEEDFETSKKLNSALEANDEILIEYGRGERDSDTFYDKIVNEAKQLPKGETGLIILRSDNARMEDIEFHDAIASLNLLISENDLLPKLSGVLFDSGLTNLRTYKRFYLWYNKKAANPVSDYIAKKLENMK